MMTQQGKTKNKNAVNAFYWEAVSLQCYQTDLMVGRKQQKP